MRMVLSGRQFGRTWRVVWDDGVLSGTTEVVNGLRIMARILDGEMVGPVTGPVTERDHLSSPFSTIFIAEELLGRIRVEGDLPRMPEVPEGAIP